MVIVYNKPQSGNNTVNGIFYVDYNEQLQFLVAPVRSRNPYKEKKNKNSCEDFLVITIMV